MKESEEDEDYDDKVLDWVAKILYEEEIKRTFIDLTVFILFCTRAIINYFKHPPCL